MKDFRIYRPNSAGNGAASCFQFRQDKRTEYGGFLLFLQICPQSGIDENNNAKFDWKNQALNVKLGELDIAELICVLSGVKTSVGTKGSLYHESPNGKGNKVINFSYKEGGGYSLSVSAQDSEKNSLGKYYHGISDAEGAILLILLKKALESIYGW